MYTLRMTIQQRKKIIWEFEVRLKITASLTDNLSVFRQNWQKSCQNGGHLEFWEIYFDANNSVTTLHGLVMFQNFGIIQELHI